MNVLIIGNGGREHALAWKIKQSPTADRVFVAPGNAGTAIDAENVPLAMGDFPALIKFAKDNDVGLTVVGPEVPLCQGLSDAFRKAGLLVFGPSADAAQLEGSKTYCKKILRAGNIDTARHWRFTSGEQAIEELRTIHADKPDDVPLVVKADGLAAGKGVVVCQDLAEVEEAIHAIAIRRELGDAGESFLLEEKLVGIEASVLAITDGKAILPLPPAQDHKAAYDNDLGPNTGGMGAYCPSVDIDPPLLDRITEEILVPTIHTMKRQNNPFSGVLYAGLMLCAKGPKVIEFNVRFGDPECQPVLMRLKSDLLEILLATAEGRLGQIESPVWDTRPTVCVVMASDGYPGSYQTGHVITGLDAAAKLPDVKIFHAGTKLNEQGQVITAGGRVLGVTAIGDNIAQAKQRAYEAIKLVRWKGAWCRKDIADKAIQVPLLNEA
ncbi:MAG: phosphoribosylamine--glycine ligase [Planctomycetaceae bacterium]|nr:phosphoribosylamine--glycine ligase [Planctomycetaceae bacterium]